MIKSNVLYSMEVSMLFFNDRERVVLRLPVLHKQITGPMSKIIELAEDINENEGVVCNFILSAPRQEYQLAPYRVRFAFGICLSNQLAEAPIRYHIYTYKEKSVTEEGVTDPRRDEAILAYVLNQRGFRPTILIEAPSLYRL